MFQNLCKQKFEWHECISDQFKGDWDNILMHLENVRTIEIPTKVLNQDEGDVHKGLNFMHLVKPASNAMAHVFI